MELQAGEYASAHLSPTAGHTFISNLAVQHDRRGQGYGTRYLQRLTEAADEHGEPLVLGVQQPKLVDWYARFGFQPVGEHAVVGTVMRREPRSS